MSAVWLTAGLIQPSDINHIRDKRRCHSRFVSENTFRTERRSWGKRGVRGEWRKEGIDVRGERHEDGRACWRELVCSSVQ